MGWQILHISQPARLTLEHKQCALFFPEQSEKVVIPINNLTAVILESTAVTLTSALLQAFAQNQIAVFVCNEVHLPNGVLLPYMPYFAYSKTAYQQVKWSIPFKNRLWQRIVQAKINNQAYVLRQQRCVEEAEKLQTIARVVSSGDKVNREGQAAALYWRTLFGTSFSRDQETFTNAALNYGYAILRGIVARCLVGSGLMPCFGLHHSNQLNAFNLADDLMEPLRPLVDMQVLQMNRQETQRLTPENKIDLLTLLVNEYAFDKQKSSLLAICEHISGSLVKATEQKDHRLFKLFVL